MTNMATLEIRVRSLEVTVARQNMDRLTRAAESLERGLSRLGNQNERSARATDRLSFSFGSLRNIIIGTGAAFAAKKWVEAADTFTLLNARIGLVTNSMEEQKQIYNELYQSANDTRSSLDVSINLYTRLARSMKDVKTNQTELLGITETINKAFKISGATTHEASAATLQLSQAFAAGILRGDEFNSVAEQAPRVMQAIADGMRVSLGELREMAANGEVTAEQMYNAFVKQAAIIDDEFKKIPVTVGDALQQLRNDMLNTFGRLDTKPVVGAINDIRDVVTDAQFQEGVARLGSTLAGLTAFVVKGAKGWYDLYDRIMETWDVMKNGYTVQDGLIKSMHQLNDAIGDASENGGKLRWGTQLVNGEFVKSGTTTDKLRQHFYSLNLQLAALTGDFDRITRWNIYYKDATKESAKETEKFVDVLGKNFREVMRELGKEYEETRERIGKRVAALELEAATVKMTREETELYKLALDGANDSELKAAASALRTVEAYNQRKDSLEAALDAEAARTEAFNKLKESLRTEEEVIRASYDERKRIIMEAETATAAEKAEMNRRNEEQLRKEILGEYANPETYQEQIAAIRKFQDDRAQLILSMTEKTSQDREALLSELYEQTNERVKGIETQSMLDRLSLAEQTYGSLADIAKTFGGESSKAYKALFAVSKGFNIAQSIINIKTALSEALKLPPPASYAKYAEIAASGASILSTIKGTQFAGAYDRGGYIPSGKYGLVGEVGPELVSGPAMVTSRRDTAAMLGGINVIIHNHGGEVETRRNGNELEIIFRAVKSRLESEVNSGHGFGRTLSNNYNISRKTLG